MNVLGHANMRPIPGNAADRRYPQMRVGVLYGFLTPSMSVFRFQADDIEIRIEPSRLLHTRPVLFCRSLTNMVTF